MEHAYQPDHTHDASVGSVGLRIEGELSSERVSEWLSALLRERGTDIFRTKGILALRGNTERLVVQGVHMLLDSSAGRPWGAAPRVSELVFIGRNLDRAELAAGLASCMA